MEKLLLICGLFIGVCFAAIPIKDDNNLDEKDISSIYNYAANALVVDFDSLAEQYVKDVAKKYNRKVSWWDLYGKHSHLRERQQYHKYKVDIKTGEFHYGRATSESKRPKVIQTKIFENRGSQKISSTISWESRQLATSKWRVTEGIRAEWEVEIDSEIPVIESQAKNKTTITLSTTREQSYQEQDLLRITYSLTVPPQSELKATWMITEREVEVPFEVQVYVNGYVSIWFSEKYDGHWLWFHPIQSLANSKFRRFENGLVYTVKGIYKGVRGLDSHIQTDEIPYNPITYSGEIRPIPGDE